VHEIASHIWVGIWQIGTQLLQADKFLGMTAIPIQPYAQQASKSASRTHECQFWLHLSTTARSFPAAEIACVPPGELRSANRHQLQVHLALHLKHSLAYCYCVPPLLHDPFPKQELKLKALKASIERVMALATPPLGYVRRMRRLEEPSGLLAALIGWWAVCYYTSLVLASVTVPGMIAC
jgi:hypothetical protein